MSLAILPPELASVNEHARRDYPHECCGFLLGKEVNGWKLVVEVRAVENVRHDSPRNRFLISPSDFRAGERYAREQKLDILGFYHSHPDHPARPSQYDQETRLALVLLHHRFGPAGDPGRGHQLGAGRRPFPVQS